MRSTLANKIFVSMVGVIVLAAVSSLVALLSSRHVGNLMDQILSENLPSMRAAEELEIAVLEQRGYVSSYLLDGCDPEWLSKLPEQRRNFHEWLDEARETACTEDEETILAELDDIYRRYDRKRSEVVELAHRGEVAAAGRLFVNEVSPLFDEAYWKCEEFIRANEQSLNTAGADVRRQMQWIAWAVGGSAMLTIALGALLLWLFLRGVVFPIRAMVADARHFAGEIPSEGRLLPTDEFRAVGIYLRNLMSDVADARTTLERSRSQLRGAEQLASVGKLAASVAHEIRNPLTAMKMWLFSIQKEVGGEEALDRKFEIVSEEIRRLENIVRNFLEFSRPPELKLAVESISSLLDGILEWSEPRLADRGIRIARNDAAYLPPVRVDKEQFKQVLLNLMNNAVDVTASGGQIRFATAVGHDADRRETVVVRVSDSGPGIPEDVSRRIFEPFFSTKEDGTGLGLCIAARIMARHQGRLILESSGKTGTTFAIYLPAAAVEPK